MFFSSKMFVELKKRITAFSKAVKKNTLEKIIKVWILHRATAKFDTFV
jgi:hypothetical protein